MQAAQPAIRTDQEVVRATTLADRLATFVKNAFVYPDNNQRVLASLADALDAMRACSLAGSTVVVSVVDAGLAVAGTTVVVGASLPAWLRATLIASRVGVVAFEATVESGVLMAWVRHLQRAHGDRAASYATSWGGAILPGIMVREFMLARGVAPEGDAGSAVDPAAAAEEIRATLARNTRIASELRALEKLLAQDAAADAGQVTDLLDELVRNLSGEAIRDPAYAAMVAERVLSSVRRTFTQHATRGRADGITPQLVEMGRKLFPRIDRCAGPIVAAPGRGHNDEHITDDPVALVAELAEVEAQGAPAVAGRGGTVARSQAQPGADTGEAAEVAGIVLHTLSTSDRLSTGGLRDRLLKQSLVASPGVKATIGAYLERVLADDLRGGKPDRLQVLVHSLDARGMLRTCGFLDAEAVALDFPRRVPLLIEACTVDQSALVLVEVARALGPTRVLVAEKWFAANRGVLTGERVERMLAAAGPALLPVAIFALRHSPSDCRGTVAAYLRSLGPTDPVAAPLSVADPHTRMPADFLELLARLLLVGGEPEVALVEAAGRALRHAAQELAGQQSKEGRRLACLSAMKDLESDHLRAYLRELISARRFLFRREPRTVRQVARGILRGWKKR